MVDTFIHSCACRCSETQIVIFWHARRCGATRFVFVDGPSRRIRCVDRAKLWRNAKFKAPGIAPRILPDVVSMLTKWSLECRSYIVFCNRVALVCVFFLCFATQGCAGPRMSK